MSPFSVFCFEKYAKTKSRLYKPVCHQRETACPLTDRYRWLKNRSTWRKRQKNKGTETSSLEVKFNYKNIHGHTGHHYYDGNMLLEAFSYLIWIFHLRLNDSIQTARSHYLKYLLMVLTT